MRAPPDHLAEADLARALTRGWGLAIGSLEYVAVGGGSYHWIAHDRAGGRHWISVDDLDQKPFLANDRDAAFDGLSGALETARALHAGGLEFVVAPRGAVQRIDARYALAVYPFLDGWSGHFGERLEQPARYELLEMLTRMHRTAPRGLPIGHVVLLGQRDSLERALDEVAAPWSSGPYGEAARAFLARDARTVRDLLERLDELAAQTSDESVITHGEPHSGNVMRQGGRLVLVDWDTVALAPPERDLWLLEPLDADEREHYTRLSGLTIDERTLQLYRLRWRLDDIAASTTLLHAAHVANADTERALQGLARRLES
jgi:spectinomycin phosphotransferase